MYMYMLYVHVTCQMLSLSKRVVFSDMCVVAVVVVVALPFRFVKPCNCKNGKAYSVLLTVCVTRLCAEHDQSEPSGVTDARTPLNYAGNPPSTIHADASATHQS